MDKTEDLETSQLTEDGVAKAASNRLSLLQRLSKSDESSVSTETESDQKKSFFKNFSCALKAAVPCPKCSGYGYVSGVEGAFAHAELCSCVKKCPICLGRTMNTMGEVAKPCQRIPPAIKVNLFNHARIPIRYGQAKLELYRNKTGNCLEVVQNVKNWLNQLNRVDFAASARGFVLSGGVGVGKTFILTSVAKVLTFNGVSVRFVDFYQLITEIKAQFNQKNRDQEDLLAPLLDVDVLIIDELGKGRRTDFEQTVIDQLVMGRYNQGKMILASTNCSLEKGRSWSENHEFNDFSPLYEAVGERIYSRLAETCYFWTMEGADYRQQNM